MFTVYLHYHVWYYNKYLWLSDRTNVANKNLVSCEVSEAQDV